jgi:hypothetical protein
VGQQLAELTGADTLAGNGFGASVDIAGTTAIIGAPNHANDEGGAHVLVKTADGWKETAELEGSDIVGREVPGLGGDFFGEAVAISGSTAVVGADGHANYAGRAYVFKV